MGDGWLKKVPLVSPAIMTADLDLSSPQEEGTPSGELGILRAIPFFLQDFAMCELLGMNSNTPTDIVFSFSGFATRATEHADGFGIAFFEGRGKAREAEHNVGGRVAVHAQQLTHGEILKRRVDGIEGYQGATRLT
jgi:hypothetical protein